MVKLKSVSKLSQSTRRSKGKVNRSSVHHDNDDVSNTENDCVLRESDGNVDVVLQKKKLKRTVARVTHEHNEEETNDRVSEEDRIAEDASDQDDSQHNGVSTSMNPGWADAMQKILKAKKPKKRKSVVLSKAKKLQDVKIKETENESLNTVKTEDAATEDVSEDVKPDDKLLQGTKSRRKDVCLGIRVKPSFAARERERMLQKIATKGVVQLFNAVRQQQTDINKKLSEAGPLERKREKVLKSIDKNTFLDVLMGGAKSVPVEKKLTEPKNEDTNEKDDKTWSVLRDDFMMGAKLKDWDKKSDSGNESSSAAEDMDSDD